MHYRRCIFLGPPGSGKGTHAPKVMAELGLKHLSTGDMLRDAVARGTKLGLEAKDVMEKGELVSDNLVVEIVGEAIQQPECAQGAGFILDGFPRTLEQSRLLDNLLSKNNTAIDCVINLDVADELLIKRITGRLIHQPSGRSYNIYFNPPKEEGKDDITGEPLMKRPDDNEEALKTRLEAFHTMTTPIINHYGNKVINIKADDDMDNITTRILNALKDVINKKNKENY